MRTRCRNDREEEKTKRVVKVRENEGSSEE